MSLRALMQANVGVVRTGAGLSRAMGELLATERAARLPALRDMAVAGLLISAAAWQRRESRGGHFRSDFPETDPKQAQRRYLTLEEARSVAHRASAKAA
jgi:L-aspartate oxidase